MNATENLDKIIKKEAEEIVEYRIKQNICVRFISTCDNNGLTLEISHKPKTKKESEN